MKKNEEPEVLLGEIVDDSKVTSNALAANETNAVKKENRMEKTGKWIDAIVFIGSGIFKLISLFPKRTFFDSSGDTGKTNSFLGKRNRRHGRRS